MVIRHSFGKRAPLSSKSLTVGTRGSKLALVQTNSIVAALKKSHPDYDFRIKIIKTEGDRDQTAGLDKIGGQGVFVKEIEAHLRDGSIDLAVHSLKDMPSQIPAGLEIGAVTAREDVRDALISPSGATLARLPEGAKIATGSPRRTVQLKAVRPDVQVAPIRGNVDTRIRKLRAGEADALLMASAGLKRLGMADIITEYMGLEDFLPAVGQAALAVEIRAGDKELQALLQLLEHKPTRQAITAERTFLAALGGGCQAPIAAHATVQGQEIELDGMVAAPDGYIILRDKQRGPADDPAYAGNLLAAKFLGRGAAKILV